jgi:hypothetical protein
MKKINLFIAALAMLLLAASCGKDGAVGPQGPKGDTGATGAIGPAGANGSVIYSGNGAPAGTTGATGDFYIDLSSGNFYGPKTGSGWGTPVSLKGAAGAAGAAGSKILSGNGAPSTSLGNNGDYYLDKTSYLFYGPKTAGGWGTGLNIQGPQGPAGNANVKVDTFTVKTADWTYGGIYYFGTSPNVSSGYFTQYYDRANTDVTDAIINGGGMIMVYFQATPDLYPDLWQPLPYTFPAYAGYGYNYYYEPSVGNIRLDFFFNKITVDPPAVNGYQIPTHKFKIVVISGTLTDMVRNNHVDIKDYKAMAKITGLWQQDKLK